MKRTHPVRSILAAAGVTVTSGVLAAWLAGTSPSAYGRADTSAQSSPASQPEATSQPADDNTRYMRVVDKPGKLMALDIAVRTYKRADGKGPEVSLVGVMHIGDHNYYKTLQKLLDSYSVVLYESVRPAGTDPTEGKNDEERAENTKAALGFLSGAVQGYEKKNGALPADLDEVADFAKKRDVRLGQWVAQAMQDGWGHLVHYAIAEDGKSFTIQSYGADNAKGGTGSAADIQADTSSDPLPLSDGDDRGLQSELASALGLEFQLDAIDYGKDNWRCADMSVDRVERELKERGSDFTVLAGTLAGSSFPAKVAKLILHMMKALDSMTDGAV
ncbi:MAG TPA: type II secretion system protein GspG, partial [Phycisphaerales bacterium]|nr:type II secretion system protein GspG [Phycisphaerales bacterium]